MHRNRKISSSESLVSSATAKALQPKMQPKMSEDKTDAVPTVIVSQHEQLDFAKKPLRLKKIIIIGLVTIFIVAIILTAILVGMFLFTKAQLDIIKFSKQLEGDKDQDIVNDPNTNIVQYHVADSDQDAWIVNDFNRDIQVMKLQTKAITSCFVTPLNRSMALSPSEITGPEAYKTNQSVTLRYRYDDAPVSDTSFLSAPAKSLCQGISVYWLYPQCEGQAQRSRRAAELGLKFVDKVVEDVGLCFFLCLCLIC